MKSRLLISLSALALLVLITMQFLFITDTYWTKQKQFDAYYGGLVKKGMALFSNEDFNYAFDSVLYHLDNLALDYLYEKQDSSLGSPGEAFLDALRSYQAPAIFLKDFIRKAGEDPDFSYHLQLNELYLIDMGYEGMVYPDSTTLLPLAPETALLAGSYTQQRNFYRVSYAIYIDFQYRTKMILNEMWLILSLSIFTVLLVFTVFSLTLRNMLRQKRLSEMKTDFINNMTHELKTPLSTISVASSSLGNRSINQQEEKVEELSLIIKKQNRHLSELIDRILDINIWERDQVRLKKQTIVPEAWIRELIRAFLLKQEDPELDIKLDFRSATLSIHLDEVHMSTAINNLLSNAVKYGTTPCKIKMGVSTKNGFLVIGISDNGPGIKKEELKHVFEKFYRGKESKERVIKGLGLGLYYVKQIVEAHGGNISANSVPGKGAEFLIQIPVQNGDTTG